MNPSSDGSTRKRVGDAHPVASFSIAKAIRAGTLNIADFVALDVETDDGSRLGDTDAVDQHGLRAHASSDLTRAMNARDERLGGELHENVFFSSRW